MPYGKSNKSIQDAAFKMKGNPMQRNFGIGSPVRDTNPHTGMNPPHRDHRNVQSTIKKDITDLASHLGNKVLEANKTINSLNPSFGTIGKILKASKIDDKVIDYTKKKVKEAKKDPVKTIIDVHKDIATEYVKPIKSVANWIKSKFN